MNQLFINSPYADSRVIERELIDAKGVRLYRYSPDRLLLQIRTSTGKQGRITNATLTDEDARALSAKLLELAPTNPQFDRTRFLQACGVSVQP